MNVSDSTRDNIEKAMNLALTKLGEEDRISCMMILNDGHHDEYTARYVVGRMVPVVLLDENKKPYPSSDINEYLSRTGMTADRISSLISSAEAVARDRASQLGITLHSIDHFTDWDRYCAYAMILADYWYTHDFVPEDIAMMAYEYLSDPDRRTFP